MADDQLLMVPSRSIFQTDGLSLSLVCWFARHGVSVVRHMVTALTLDPGKKCFEDELREPYYT